MPPTFDDHAVEQMMGVLRTAFTWRLYSTLAGLFFITIGGIGAIVSFVVTEANNSLRQNIGDNRELLIELVQRIEDRITTTSQTVETQIAELRSVNTSLESLTVSISSLKDSVGTLNDHIKDLDILVSGRSLIGILAGMRELNIFSNYINSLQRYDILTPYFDNPHFFTILAPSDDAIQALPVPIRERFKNHDIPANRQLLERFVLSHFVPGHYQASDFFGEVMEVTTLSGHRISITGESGKVLVYGQSARNIDVPATDGIIHVITRTEVH